MIHKRDWFKVLLAVCSWLGAAESWISRNPARRISPMTSAVCASTTTVPIVNEDAATEVSVLADWKEFVQPERDPRKYRLIRLPNNLIALLVSDELRSGVGIEAASVHVQAGHFDDTVPGLAHFHEHMLFLGTKKYPDEDEYESYLSRYGGYSNAYTDMEDTNYYFSMTTEADECFDEDGQPIRTTNALSGALDRLSQFFIAPTFDRDAVDRELRAIDSEYRNGKTSDVWRNFSLLKASANQEHPFAKFGCGNYETLSSKGMDHLLNELQRFWDDYYQTYNLRLAVVGHGSLDALQKTVLETFGNLPTSNGPPRREINQNHQFFPREHAVHGIPAFGSEQLGVYRRVLPFTETRKVKISFATPPMEDPRFQKSKPYRALSHFLGHEGPGSLHAVLNEEGLLTSLTSGISCETSDFSLFSITLALTPKGMAETEKVLDLIFQWIALLKQQSDEQIAAYHEELRQMASNGFRFRENADPTEFCSAISEMLFADDLNPSTVLTFNGEAGEYDSQISKAFLDRLSPSNCFITVVSSDFESEADSWQEEQWYGAKFRDEPFDGEIMKQWETPQSIDPRLQVPGRNKFIPADFSLRCDSSNIELAETDHLKVYPKLLMEDRKLRLWHKQDAFWRVPKTHIKIALQSPSMYETPRSMTLNRIFQRVLSDDLNSFVYDASVAGCSYKLSAAPTGFRLSVEGYSEKLPFVLETLMSRIFSLIDEMKQGDHKLRLKFEKAKEALLQDTKNHRLGAPYEVCNYNSRLLLEEKGWSLDDYVDLMEGEDAKLYPLFVEECADVALKSFTSVKCELLCMGNVSEEEAYQVAKTLESKFLKSQPPLSDSELPVFRTMMIPTVKEASQMFGSGVDSKIPIVYQELSVSETEENNAIELFFQVGSELELGYRGIVLIDLISHMASTSAFATLRTNEQLGYIVSAHARKTTGGGWGLAVVVQSSVALPEYLETRVGAWLESYREELGDMEIDDIVSEASAVAAQYMEKETKLVQEVGRVWGDILGTESLVDSRLRVPSFNRIDLLAKEMASLIENPTELKASVLEIFDKYFSASSPERRAISARLYRQEAIADFKAAQQLPGVLSSYKDIRYLKHFLRTMPDAPYWLIQNPAEDSGVKQHRATR